MGNIDTPRIPSDATPQANAGAGSAGTSLEYSRADHVHPAAPSGGGVICVGVSGGASIPAAITYYAPPAVSATWNPTEANRQWVAPKAFTAANLTVYLTTAQPATGNMVFTLRKNGVDTALTVTVPAGYAGGVLADNVNTVDIAAGDILSVKAVNNAAAGSGLINCASMST